MVRQIIFEETHNIWRISNDTILSMFQRFNYRNQIK